MIKINSSATSSASSTMCYHSDCPDSFVVGTSCFQYRLALRQSTRGRSDEITASDLCVGANQPIGPTRGPIYKES